ncbi:toxin [Actinomadura cremea]|nr:toxin [Actinomadura cremea]
MMDRNNELAWRKSRYSNNGGNCVEVASWRKSRHSGNGGVDCVEVGACGCCGTAVRDSKDPDGAKLAFGVAAWRAFHADVVAGRYDLG